MAQGHRQGNCMPAQAYLLDSRSVAAYRLCLDKQLQAALSRRQPRHSLVQVCCCAHRRTPCASSTPPCSRRSQTAPWHSNGERLAAACCPAYIPHRYSHPSLSVWPVSFGTKGTHSLNMWLEHGSTCCQCNCGRTCAARRPRSKTVAAVMAAVATQPGYAGAAFQCPNSSAWPACCWVLQVCDARPAAC